jgi:hypothetical protein
VKRRIVIAVVTGAVLLLVMAAAWVAVVVNPFEWGAEHSVRFTWEKFNEVRPGQPIAQVIETLGEPIKAPTIYESMTGNESTRICTEIGRCKQYQFAGVQFVGGREAIVIADARTSIVVDKRINYEP